MAALRLIVGMAIGADTEHSIGSGRTPTLAFVSWQHRAVQGDRCEREEKGCDRSKWYVCVSSGGYIV
jgi:hypothetical protein